MASTETQTTDQEIREKITPLFAKTDRDQAEFLRLAQEMAAIDEENLKELERIINTTYRRGGKIIVPAFAVGRTQQLVYTLNQLASKGDIPRLPIYVDSPLAVNTTDVFRSHPECYDSETQEFIMQMNGKRDPFGFEHLYYTRSVEDSKQLNFLLEPAIIISASGMAETGRILHHLKNNIEDRRTTVLIVGWQAPDTLGRRLVDGEKIVSIFGDKYHVAAQVEVLNGFSGHADRDELLSWVEPMKRKPRRTFLVHGELSAANALASSLRPRCRMPARRSWWRATSSWWRAPAPMSVGAPMRLMRCCMVAGLSSGKRGAATSSDTRGTGPGAQTSSAKAPVCVGGRSKP